MFSVAAIVVLPFLAQAALAGPCVRTYTVQEGDICDSISAANNVSTYQLATANLGYIDTACSNLQPGANICIGYEGEDCSTTYVVAENDTCDDITQAHAINSTLLYGNNPQLDAACDNLYIGEVLCVADVIAAPPIPSGSTVATAIPSTAVPAVSTTVATVAVTTAAASSVTPSASAAADEDDDLPWCDEL